MTPLRAGRLVPHHRILERTGLAPFESVKTNAMKQARDQYLSEYRIRYLKQLSSAPIELPDGAVEAMARRYFGDDLELSPDFLE